MIMDPDPVPIPTPEPISMPIPTPTPMPAPVPTNMPIPTPTHMPTPVPTSMPIPTPTPMPTPVPLPPMNPELDEFQQDMLDAVNTARMQARTCGSTNFGPTTPIKWNKAIQSSTLMHSIDMNDNSFFSHIGSDGSNTGDRLTRVGYAWRGWGENIASGFQDIDSVMNAWLNSAGHCANIMNPNWEEMGASEFNLYWTQVFAMQ